jgi:ribosomal protein S6
MKLYELNYLISSNLSQEELKAFQEKIENLIREEGGFLVETKNSIKRTLLYQTKTKLNPSTETAYFVTLNFNLVPEKVKNVEKKLKAENQILRYLILNKEIKKATSPLPREGKSSFPPTELSPRESKSGKEARLFDFAAARVGEDATRVPKMPETDKLKSEKTKKDKVKLEEIDEKLEEILGDV